jgi:hypothetical protein
MKKLMLTGCAVLALMGPALSESPTDILKEAFAATSESKLLDARDPTKDPIAQALKSYEQPVAPPAPVPEEVLPCADKSVLDTLQRLTHSDTIDGVGDLRSEDPTLERWCKARIIGPWGFVEVAFTIQWTSKAEGRFWVTLRQSHGY